MRWNPKKLEAGPVPLWFQIAERLRAAIEKGSFVPGDRLPSETELNQQFGVSRTTARAALDRLKNEGRISRRSGKGSIVLPPKVDQPLNVLRSFGDDMRARGLEPSYRMHSLKTAAATAAAAEQLRIAVGTPCILIDRLLLADRAPLAASHTWLSPRVLGSRRPPTASELNTGSLYEWIESACSARIVSGEEYVEAATATAAVARQLQIRRGDAVLIVRRTSFTQDGTPVEHVIRQYRADRYRFRVELTRP